MSCDGCTDEVERGEQLEDEFDGATMVAERGELLSCEDIGVERWEQLGDERTDDACGGQGCTGSGPGDG